MVEDKVREKSAACGDLYGDTYTHSLSQSKERETQPLRVSRCVHPRTRAANPSRRETYENKRQLSRHKEQSVRPFLLHYLFVVVVVLKYNDDSRSR